MKQILLIIALVFGGLSLVGAGVYVYTTQASPAAKVCRKVEQTCGEELITAADCRESLEGATEHELAEVERCVEPSGSCIEIVGCLGGSVMRDLGRGFLRGVSGSR